MTESGNDLIEIVVQRLISIPTKQFLDEEIKPLFDYMRYNAYLIILLTINAF